VDGYPRFLCGEIRDRSLIIHRGGQEEINGNLNNAKKISLSPCTLNLFFFFEDPSPSSPDIFQIAMAGVTSRAIS